MKNNSPITKVLVAALVAVALIGVAAAAFDYEGQMDFNLGTNGVNLRLNGSEVKK